jgi:TatD DNase family protein
MGGSPLTNLKVASHDICPNVDPLMLIDTHCHLDFPDFAPEQADVVARAKARGVGRMITISTHLSRVDRVRAVAEAYPDVFFTVGTHPHHAHE